MPDPIGLSGGINLYAYVSNDPINGTDPYGLSPHLGFIKMLARMADKSVRKTVISLEKKIAKHEKALTDPTQELAKKHHEHELRIFKEQHKLATKEASRRGLSGILPFIGTLLDPFEAISGELARDEEYLQQIFENNQDTCK